jgi:hypothetical protein
MLNHKITEIALSKITTEQMQAWINERKLQVIDGTVRQELTLLSNIINTARREWKWCNSSPLTDTRKPKEPAHRDRRLLPLEQERILSALDYSALHFD